MADTHNQFYVHIIRGVYTQCTLDIMFGLFVHKTVINS